MEDRSVYHGMEVKLEGSIVAADPRDISGPGKAACVVFTVSVKWQNKEDKNTMYVNVKVLGELGENVLENEDLKHGDRVTVYGKMEESSPWPTKVELEDGSEAKAYTRKLSVIADSVSPNYRFGRNDGSWDGKNSSEDNTTAAAVKKPEEAEVKTTTRRKRLLD